MSTERGPNTPRCSWQPHQSLRSMALARVPGQAVFVGRSHNRQNAGSAQTLVSQGLRVSLAAEPPFPTKQNSTAVSRKTQRDNEFALQVCYVGTATEEGVPLLRGHRNGRPPLLWPRAGRRRRMPVAARRRRRRTAGYASAFRHSTRQSAAGFKD